MPYAYPKGFVSFCAGTVRVPVDFIRAWEYDYVCRHCAGPCRCHKRVFEYCMLVSGRTGPDEAREGTSCYIYQVKPDYVPFDQ